MKNRKRPLLLAFCIPVAVMLAVIVYRGIYPFGEKCFLRVDMYNQYMPFFMEFHRKIREGESLFFSWRGGLGANFLALYAYYLASPVNWLLYFCPQEFIIEFMTVLIVIKTGLCGLTFAWYLRHRFSTEDYAITVFSLFYALSGFMAAYNWNIMWLDCVFLAPLVIGGLEDLVYRKKTALYCISLGLCVLTNYYISIPICIFIVLYYFVLVASLSPMEFGKSLKRFIVYSLLGGGLAGIVLIPGTAALFSTRFAQTSFPDQIKCYFNLPEILSRHCVNVAAEIRSDHWPNLYCGVAVFFFLPLYLCCKGISWKEKVPRLLLLCFFYMSYAVNILDFFWHGLNFPDNLPARQSFLYIFLVLTLCFETYRHLCDFSFRELLLHTGAALLLLGFCCWFGETYGLEADSFNFSLGYLTVYAILLIWQRTGSLGKNVTVTLMLCMATMEVAMNTIETSVPVTSRSAYHDYYKKNSSLKEYLEKEEESGYYRVELYDRMTKNDGMLSDFPTATFFSSTTNGAMSRYYRQLGMSSSKVFYCYEGATPLTSAMLSVDYIFSDSLEITDDFHRLLKKKDDFYIYQNEYTLPVGYVVPSDVRDMWNLEEGNPIEVQNNLAEVLGLPPLFWPLSVEARDGRQYIETEVGGYVYAYPEACSTRDITAQIDGYEKVYEKVYYPHILDIGWCNQGAEICLMRSGDKRRDKEELEISAWMLDETVLEEAVERLGSSPMEIEEYSDIYIRGIVDGKEGGYLATSIPNEKGWRVWVDGNPAGILPFGGAMIGVELPAGKHTVIFSYRSPGIYEGMTVSIISVAILLLLSFRNRYERHSVSEKR